MGLESRNHPSLTRDSVDTNVLVRLITRDEAGQAASADLFVQRGAWVSVLALAEATWVLAAVYERNAADLATAVEMLLHHNDLTLQDPEVVAAALDLFRSRARRGFFGLPDAATGSKGRTSTSRNV